MEKSKALSITNVYRDAAIDHRVHAHLHCGDFGCEAVLSEAGGTEQLALQALWKRVKASDWKEVDGHARCGVCVKNKPVEVKL